MRLTIFYWAGGNANIPGLAKLLQQKLGYRVTISNPFLQMGFSPEIDIKKIENECFLIDGCMWFSIEGVLINGKD